MLMVVDVGNTNMVFGVYQDQQLISSFRLTTGANRTSDEIGSFIWDHFQRFKLDATKVKDVVICSVVPGVMHTLCSAIIKYINRTPIVINDDVDTGMVYPADVKYPTHGADRQVAVVAAIEKYGAPLVVLDFGTATTLDIIDKDGIYRGGSILAGVQISVNALFTKTAKLPQVTLAVPDKMLGLDTISQIQAGAMGGYIGAIEYLIRRSMEELGEPASSVKVVATGGLARLIASNTHVIDVVDANLILDGLVNLYKRYKAEQGEPLR